MSFSDMVSGTKRLLAAMQRKCISLKNMGRQRSGNRRIREVHVPTLIGMLLIILGGVLGYVFLSNDEQMYSTWRYAENLPIGTIVQREDVEMIEVVDNAWLDVYRLSKGFTPIGKTLGVNISVGELVRNEHFGIDARRRHVVLPIEKHHIPQEVRQGDLVNVWVTEEMDDTFVTKKVAERILVYEVGRTEEIQEVIPLTVSTSEYGSEIFVKALRRGKLDIVLSYEHEEDFPIDFLPNDTRSIDADVLLISESD